MATYDDQNIENTPEQPPLVHSQTSHLYDNWESRYNSLGLTGVIAVPNTTFEDWLTWYKGWIKQFIPLYNNTINDIDDRLTKNEEHDQEQDSKLDEILGLQGVMLKKDSNIINAAWFGATGDGNTDDTIAIQAAIDSLAKGGIVYVPKGIYMIKAHDSVQALDRPYYLYDTGGIALKDNITLLLDDGATLAAIPNTEHNYNVIRIVGRNNVKIKGGKIRGDLNRRGTSQLNGEWGYGIALQGSSNVTIEDIDIQQNMGDAINLQAGLDNVTQNKHVIINNVRLNHNYRQGISVEGVEHCIIQNSTIEGTGGTAPEAGIDLEPGYDVVKNHDVLILNNKIINNTGAGIMVTRRNPTDDSNTEVVIQNNYFANNQGEHTTDYGVHVFGYGAKKIKIIDNTFDGGGGLYGIYLFIFDYFVISNNQFKDSGVHLRTAHNGVVNNNLFSINQEYPSFLFFTNSNVGAVSIHDNIFNALGYVKTRPVDVSTIIKPIYLNGEDLNFHDNKLINILTGIYSIATNSSIINNTVTLTYMAAIEITGKATRLIGNTINGSNLYGGGEGAIVVRPTATDSVILDNIIYSEPQLVEVPDRIWQYKYPKFALWLDFSGTTPPNFKVNKQILIDTASNPLKTLVSNDFSKLQSYIKIINSGQGSGNSRPTNSLAGDTFFDTNINKPIIAKTTTYPGNPTQWVDFNGATV